jgi:hypothetical protein
MIVRQVKQKDINEAASLLGKRSAAARKKKWGAEEFKHRMQQWGKLGGRPPKKAAKSLTKRKGAKH